MRKPQCIYCSRYLPLVESGMCEKCDAELKKYHARTADFCVNAPCLTPDACRMARTCKGIEN